MTLNVEHWPVDRLTPYARNPRKNDQAVAQMCAAIREFGFRIPIVVRPNGSIVDGHLRLKAAIKLGLEVVPVALASDLSDAQVRAFRLLANRSASWADFDEELLKLELEDLKDAGYELGLTGFDDKELQQFLEGGPTPGLTDEDAIPESPADPATKRGDLIILGKHRLLCGDATDATSVDIALNGARPHLMVTDPPYGVDYDPTWRAAAGVSNSDRTGKVANDHRADWREAWELFLGDTAYVWHAAIHSTTVADSLKSADFGIRAQIIWKKNHFALGRGDYHWGHEPCWYAVRRKATSHWQGARDQSTVWSISAKGPEDAATTHGTQKPVELMRRAIQNNSAPGDAVYEPFAGSGSTLIAAETIDRSCIALELDPTYCDVIVNRWENFTGQRGDRTSCGGPP
jgi:DNA modification methylase